MSRTSGTDSSRKRPARTVRDPEAPAVAQRRRARVNRSRPKVDAQIVELRAARGLGERRGQRASPLGLGTESAGGSLSLQSDRCRTDLTAGLWVAGPFQRHWGERRSHAIVGRPPLPREQAQQMPRILLLYTGKGGVGKTSVAAATARSSAPSAAYRTLVCLDRHRPQPGRRARRAAGPRADGDRAEPVGPGAGRLLQHPALLADDPALLREPLLAGAASTRSWPRR